MPIGSAKIGVLGAGLVPGGTTTFNASGTFTVPPGVKKVNITGKGGTGNPGNAGNAGNAGNPGTGSGGGAGGHTRLGPLNNNCYSTNGQGGCGGVAFKVNNRGQLFFNQPIGQLPVCYYGPLIARGGIIGPGSPTGPQTSAQPGINGNAGTAGTAGNAGNPGQASSGLCKTFPGGAGGNAGAGGAAGNGGTAGSIGNNGVANNSCSNPAPGGTGGNAAGNGGPGPFSPTPCTPANTTKTIGGGGGGGAGVTNSGTSGNPGSPTTTAFGNPCQRNVALGGTFPCVSGPPACNPYASYAYPRPPTTFPTVASGGYGGAGSPGLLVQGTPAIVVATGAGGAVPLQVPYAGPPTFRQSYPCFNPAPLRPQSIRAGGGGGSGGYADINLCQRPFRPGFRPGSGAGGGGRGNIGNAGGNSSAPSGSAGTPQTFNCVPVTPGGSYPITVGGPAGGQVVISWNPQ